MKPLLKYDDKQDFFIFSRKAIELLDTRNHQAFITSDGWETDVTGYRVHAMWLDGTLLSAYDRDVDSIKIFPFKKDGLRVELGHTVLPVIREGKNNIHIISACKKGFHRDWNHDAICVKDNDSPESPIFLPDLTDYEGQTLEDLNR